MPVTLGIAYAVAALVAFVVGVATDAALLYLVGAAVVVVGVLHVMRVRQGVGPTRIKDRHDRDEAAVREGNPPPERPKGI